MASRCNNTKAVMIVALYRGMGLPKLVITKEFRVPLEDHEWGFPAGLIDNGETIEEATRRELKEETGLDVVSIDRVSPFIYNSPGLTDESVAIAYVNVEGAPSKEFLEASEDIETILLDQIGVANLLKDNTLKFGAKAWMVMDLFARTGQI